MSQFRLEPRDEYNHAPGAESNFNESVYVNGFELDRRFGGWMRLGNRVNEGHAETQGLKLGLIAQPLRAALTGRTASPGIFEVMAVLGKDETLGRLADTA